MDEQEKEIEEILRTFDKAPSPSSENSVQNQAQQNNKQPRQISQKPTDTERIARTSNQTEYKRQAQSSKVLSVKLDAPAPCRLDAPDLDLICYASADCLHQHLQVI